MFKLKLAFKYAFSRNGGQRTTAIMMIIGIATSIVAVLVIASIMNGLQNSQLQKMRNVESFDLIVNSNLLKEEELLSIKGVSDVVPFFETNVLITNKSNGKSSVSRVRCYDYSSICNTRINDSLRISIDEDTYEKGVFLSYSIRSSLSYKKQDSLQFTFLKPGKSATVVPFNAIIDEVGVYQCNVSDFTNSTILMSNKLAGELLDIDISSYGLFIDGSIKEVKKSISSLDEECSITLWPEYNKSFYSALMLEKAMMYVFLGFMFLILCVNLKNSTNRLLERKKNEGAMLRAIGATRSLVDGIFIYQGLVIILSGEFLGFVLSKLVIDNIQTILSFIDSFILRTTGIISYLGSGLLEASISFTEIIIVLASVLVLSFVFIYRGCVKVFKKEIMEVLINESY